MKVLRIILVWMVLLSVAGCAWFERSGSLNGVTEAALGEWIISDEVGVAGRSVHADRSGKSNVYYEIFVRAFADSDGDGIGDLRGVINMLDYLNDGDPLTDTDLEVSGIWLMPIQPSPSYHGYDVTDYYGVHPEYGTIEDFRQLVEEAHKRGIEVIIDLVVNHTSSEHPWFRSAAMDSSNEYRDWYVWRESAGQGMGTSATGGQAWHPSPGGGADYLGVFWGGMPDLNFHHEAVRREMIEIGKFWLEQGVDGFRIDAAKHIFEDLSGDEKKVERQESNIAWWAEFRAGLEEVNPDVYIVGEVWDSSPARIAPYYQVFDSVFNFAAGEMIVSSVASEENGNLAFSLERMHGAYERMGGERFIDAPFLTNHDQNRVMSSLRESVDQAKMAAAILLTLPGRPFLYYGEEIGMRGVKPDEEIREPMKWIDEKEAEAEVAVEGKQATHARFTVEDYTAAMTSWRAPRHQVDTLSVVAQEEDSTSLLNHYRALVRLRGRLPVLINGVITPVDLEPSQAMAYERRTAADRVLVVHNLGDSEMRVTIVPDAQSVAYEQVLAASKAGIVFENAGEAAALMMPPYSTVILK